MTEERRAAPAPKSAEVDPTASDPPPASSTSEIAAIDDERPSEAPAKRIPVVAPASPTSTHPPSNDGEARSRSSIRDSSPGVGAMGGTGGTGAGAGTRRRGRMTLRIPDDEVSRPQPAVAEIARSEPPPQPRSAPAQARSEPPPTQPRAGPPQARSEAPAQQSAPAPARSAPADEGAVLKPMRIITINPPPGEVPAPVAAPPPPATPAGAPAKVQGEDSWTPFQPTVTDQAAPSTDGIPDSKRPLVLDDIPIDADAPVSSDSAESIEPMEDVPSQPSPTPPPPPSRSTARTEPEGEEVAFEDDAAATPIAPPVDVAMAAEGERTSDPGAEIAVEDVVAVEAAVPPAKLLANLPPMRPRLSSQPPTPPPTKKGTAPKLAKPPLVIVPPHVGTMGPQSSEGSAARRKGKLWWEDLFNDDYLRTCEKLTDDQISREVDFIEDSLSIEKGGTVLDLACGTGRHAIDFARRGYEVVGFDLSLAMLARAGDEAQDRDAKLNFIQGDMREMTFEEQFDGVYCWNTSFGYFEEEKNSLIIERIHRALKSEGLLLLDVINRDFLIRQSPSLAWFEGEGCVCMDEMNVDFITSRMKVKRTIMLDDGRSKEVEYSMRVYSLHELGRILHELGFKVCEVSGRVATPGVFFGNESPRTIILAEKR